jgi:hypothetical protein
MREKPLMKRIEQIGCWPVVCVPFENPSACANRLVPRGHPENSPAFQFQRRVRNQTRLRPEEGTAESVRAIVPLNRPFGMDADAGGDPALKRRPILSHPSGMISAACLRERFREFTKGHLSRIVRVIPGGFFDAPIRPDQACSKPRNPLKPVQTRSGLIKVDQARSSQRTQGEGEEWRGSAKSPLPFAPAFVEFSPCPKRI